MGSRFKVLKHLELKNTGRTKDMEQNSTNLGNLVVGARARIFSVVNTSMLFQNRRGFIGCKVDPSCETHAIPPLIILHAVPVLSKVSNIDGKEQVCSSAGLYVESAEGIVVGNCLILEEVPERLPAMRLFPLYVLYLLRTYFG